jgi:hypothetical protein
MVAVESLTNKFHKLYLLLLQESKGKKNYILILFFDHQNIIIADCRRNIMLFFPLVLVVHVKKSTHGPIHKPILKRSHQQPNNP